MKRRDRSKAMPSAAAEPQPDACESVDNGESAPKRHHEEGAGRGSSALCAGDMSGSREQASDHRDQPETVVGDEQAATTGHGQHLPDNPPDGTRAPRTTQLHPAIARQLLVPVLTVSTSIRCLAVCGLSGVAGALKTLARRIRTFVEGEHSPSPPPHLLHRLTDEMLVVANDAVTAVAVEGKALSGKGQQRLLAWTVADARGAQVALDKLSAETVGKRLERQANRVRASLAEAAAVANEARAHARATAADDTALTAELDKIDDAEQDVHDFHFNEVYVGFTELDKLLGASSEQVSTVEVQERASRVAGRAISTQTELMDLSSLDAALTSSWRASIRGKPEDQRSLTALLQGALDHIVELDLRLASERDRNETLRADVIRERGRADARVAEAEEREAEAVRRAARTGRKLEEAERQLSERECEVEDAKAASDMEHIGEKNELRARIRGLTHELALVKGTS